MDASKPHRRASSLQATPSVVAVALLLIISGPTLVVVIAQGEAASDGPQEADASAGTIWPMFHHDPRHTGLSPFDTSNNIGALKWRFATQASAATHDSGVDS